MTRNLVKFCEILLLTSSSAQHNGHINIKQSFSHIKYISLHVYINIYLKTIRFINSTMLVVEAEAVLVGTDKEWDTKLESDRNPMGYP